MARLLRHRRTKGPATDRPSLNHRATPRLYVRREKARIFSGCKSRPATWSLQPVAIGAAVEATKPPKPSMQRVASGDSASRQAVTRVNAEQAPKGLTWEPTRRGNGEGRRHWGTGGHTPRSDANQWSHRGIGDGMPAHGDPTQHGKPRAVAGVTANWRPARAGPGRPGWRTGPYDRGRRVTPAEGRGLSSRLTSEGA
jgi:hypothetical protein